MYMSKDNSQRYTVGVLVDNEPGVLSRVSGLFFRRGFNIDSLAVGTTHDPEVSRITIVIKGDEQKVEQLVQQLYKLICVQKVQVMQARNSVERQLLLVKVKAGVQESVLHSFHVWCCMTWAPSTTMRTPSSRILPNVYLTPPSIHIWPV